MFFRVVLQFILVVSIFGNVFAREGRVVREVVHGASLEHTATGENPDRSVTIYLPPSYDSSSSKRYPVVYLLHGIGDTDKTWTSAWSAGNAGYATIPEVLDKGIADGLLAEMIVVMPDQKTKWFGSFYVDSSATGNWEDFTARELVGYVDRKFRTLAQPTSRGIAGHSMGGYGALTLAMKHPEVYSVAFGMNPALIDWGGDLYLTNPRILAALEAKGFDDLLKTKDLYTMGIVTIAQAFSPNPTNPPFFADLPFVRVNGRVRPVEKPFSQWREKSALRMIPTHRANLNRLRGFRFDSGYDDEFTFIPVNCRAFSNELTNNGIEHIFEEYNGDHRNRLWGRDGRILTEVLPYFSRLLDH